MNLSHPTKELIQSLQGPDASALHATRELAEKLAMAAHALSKSPAALLQLCKQIHPDAGAQEAVNQVLAQLNGLPASVDAFNEQWSTVAQELLNETKFLRLAAMERGDAIGEELRQLSNKLASEKAQANAKRKALIDAGVAADEVARLAPEPADNAHGEQTATLHAERAVYTEFFRSLDATKLPPGVLERAKQLEHQKDWKIGVPQKVGA